MMPFWLNCSFEPHALALDPVVFSYYYRRHFSHLVWYARHMFGWNELTAQDVVQDCYAEFWQRYAEMGLTQMHPRQFRHFVRRMVGYRGQQWRRREAMVQWDSLEQLQEQQDDEGRTRLDQQVAIVAPVAVSEPVLAELVEQAEAVIAEQQEQYRQVLQLLLQGYTPPQVAVALGRSAKSIDGVVQQARKRVVRALYQQDQRHAKVLAAMRRFFGVGTCRQCGVMAVLSSGERCAACFAHAGRVVQDGCRVCGQLAGVREQGMCHACYMHAWRSRKGQAVCIECGQKAHINKYHVCPSCVERIRQQPCNDCGQTNVPKVKGRCQRCYEKARRRECKTAQAVR